MKELQQNRVLAAGLFAACALSYTLLLAAALAGARGYALEPVARSAAAHDHAQMSHVPGYLGVEFKGVTAAEAAALHLPKGSGVEVLMVDHDGPAGAAGLHPHDILLKFNGQVIKDTELPNMIHDAGAGTSVALTLLRNGQPVMLTVHLANREEVERRAWPQPAPSGEQPAEASVVGAAGGSAFVETDSMGASPGTAGSADARGRESFLDVMLHVGPYTGVALQAMGPQLGAYFGAPRGTGLLVSMVAPNSPAAAAGLRAGDVVLRVDAAVVHSTSDWAKQMRAAKGRPVALVVLRDKQQETLTLTPAFKKR